MLPKYKDITELIKKGATVEALEKAILEAEDLARYEIKSLWVNVSGPHIFSTNTSISTSVRHSDKKVSKIDLKELGNAINSDYFGDLDFLLKNRSDLKLEVLNFYQ